MVNTRDPSCDWENGDNLVRDLRYSYPTCDEQKIELWNDNRRSTEYQECIIQNNKINDTLPKFSLRQTS